MKYELIIVRYGEIGLKAKETRKRFVNSLVNNIKNAFSKKQILSKIKKERGRIYVYTNQIDESITILQKVFGVVSVSPAVYTQSDMASMSDVAVGISKEMITRDNSFALRVTRIGKHEFTSQDVAVKIGDDIVKSTNASVNLSKPDFELFIEIRNDTTYIFTEKIRGAGGLPLGTQEKLIALINNQKSILAAWYLMRRGCNTIFAITEESIIEKLQKFTSYWFTNCDFIVIDKNESFEKLNEIAKNKNCSAIVTGHCLCEQSEADFSEIKTITKNSSYPVFHPLIAMETEKINEKCKEIGL